ncbi:MAG: adenylate/guanylate cyclase domain-containing protein, partial [Leptospiraceae bacterium]|nr:adenylate/guanylate cyclase domain-containing protein [Leptospiraceae bacterium]
VVNLASRIEQLNKTYNSKILVSEEVYNGNPGDKGELIGEVEVKGRKEKVKIYKLA